MSERITPEQVGWADGNLRYVSFLLGDNPKLANTLTLSLERGDFTGDCFRYQVILTDAGGNDVVLSERTSYTERPLAAEFSATFVRLLDQGYTIWEYSGV